jgi:predicted RNA methylase
MSKTEITQTKGLRRNTIDKYYTAEFAVDLCLSHIQTYIQTSETDLIIEPSAGNGAFIPGIKAITNHYEFYDLEPENEEIIKQDYLCYDYVRVRNKYEKIHIIGNPPFGRQSSFAIKFIKKSCEFCNSISFILPKSFKKESLRKTFPANFHLLFETDLPDKSFLVQGIEHNVPCIFQIWEKKDYNREVTEKLVPLNFSFVSKTESPHISFRRVGVNAGNIDTNIDEKSVQSHYFIKFDKTPTKVLYENIQNLQYSNKDHTIGPKSISKQELIREFNTLFE